MRFMALVYGVTPYGANGDGVVDNYRAANGGGLVRYSNGTPGIAPQPGDVLSFTDSISPGHVGVVAEERGRRKRQRQHHDVESERHRRRLAHASGDELERRRVHAPQRAQLAARSRGARPGGHEFDDRSLGRRHRAPGRRVLVGHTVRARSRAAAHPSSATRRPSALNAPIVDIAATPTGKGYWLARCATAASSASATPRSTAAPAASHLNQPVVGMAATPTGKGYWLAASDGGIFSFGDARFHGSTGGIAPQPAHRRHGPDADRPGLLARRIRRRHLQLRRRAVPRQHRRHPPQPTHRRHGRHAQRARATGSPRPTAASSASATPRSTAARAATISTIRSSGIARTTNGRGYWLVETDGVTVHAFGNARGALTHCCVSPTG